MKKNPLLIPELRELIATGDIETIRTLCENTHPVVFAELLSPLSGEEVWAILQYAAAPVRSEIFAHLSDDTQAEIITILERRETAALLADMAPDDRADLFKQLPVEVGESILPAMAQAEREDIRRLASYAENTAGAVMTSDYATLSPDLTAAQAVERLREVAPDKETIYYAYVLDHSRRLLGFVSLRDLIVARRDATVGDIMHIDPIVAYVGDDQEDAARKIQKFDLLALPVLDEHDALVGIITHDDAIDVITQEHTEDIEKLMAITGSHEVGAYLKTSSFIHFKNRAGWVVGLAILGLISGSIIHSYQNTLMHLMILALYMPMLADTGGNTGSQSSTVVIRALALREITPRDATKVLFKECKISVLLALVLGALSWGKVLLLSRATEIPLEFSLMRIAFVISLALGVQVVSSTMIGAILPLGVAKMKLDPAVVASPALTTIVDITGLLIYFTIARMLLGV